MADRSSLRHRSAETTSADKRMSEFMKNAGRTGNVPLVASAQIMSPKSRRVNQTQQWQNESWEFYYSLGEFNFAVTWFSETMSRIRLAAAYQPKGGDEPELISEGPAADIMAGLGGGIGGQAQIMRDISIQLLVAADGYVVITATEGVNPCGVYSIDEIKSNTQELWQLQIDEGKWLTLDENTLVIRIWSPDPRRSWQASSSARAAISIMRRLDLLDRRLTAQTLSRLVGNGILLYPQEIQFDVPEAFRNSPNQFAAMLVDAGQKSVQEPGTPGAAIPMPIAVPSEYIDKFVHLQFNNELDEKITELRTFELERLGTSLRMPSEALSGKGSLNHWGQWQIEEEALKIYFSTSAELICHAFTKGFLQPVLRTLNLPTSDANGEIIVWYDISELAQRPDLSSTAVELHNDYMINDEAVLRETGLSLSDKPTEDELRYMILRKALDVPAFMPDAARQLAGIELTPVPLGTSSTGPGVDSGNQPAATPSGTGPPNTQEAEPPSEIEE